MDLGERIAGHLAAAYALARTATGSSADAEDAVGAAVTKLLSGSGGYDPQRPFFPYFARAVVNAAHDIEAAARRRAAHEEAAMIQAQRGRTGAAGGAEMAEAVRAALASLPAEERTAVLLTHMEGLSQVDAGAILGVPKRTVCDRARRGVERLRVALARAGYAAMSLPAAVAALASQPAPAGLVSRVDGLIANAAAAPSGAAAAAGAALKGGLIVKIGLGVAAAGLVAGATFWAVAGRTEETPKPKAPSVVEGPATPSTAAPGKKSRFSTPVWHPDARWERVDGMENWDSEAIGATALISGSGTPSNVYRYDTRLHENVVISGFGKGWMDGPLSRARFSGLSYANVPTSVTSSDGRFHVRTDPTGGGAVRILDFKEQMARTAFPPGSGAQGMVINSRNQAMILLWGGRLATVDPATAKVVSEVKLKATDGLSLGIGRGLALDEKKNRLYASGQVVQKDGKTWHVWYFDLNDGGSFHGVLAGERTGPNNGYAGPFDGYKGYGEHSIAFGPDDPDCRFLYLRVTDTSTFMRLDLEKRMVAVFSGPPKGKNGPAMFVEQGACNPSLSHARPAWLANGDFVLMIYEMVKPEYYRRIQ